MTPEQCEPVAVLHGTANSLPSRRRRSFQPRRSEWARCGSLLWMRLVWTTWRATRPVPSGLGGWSAGERGLPGPPLALAGARRGLRCGRRACHGRARCSASHRGTSMCSFGRPWRTQLASAQRSRRSAVAINVRRPGEGVSRLLPPGGIAVSACRSARGPNLRCGTGEASLLRSGVGRLAVCVVFRLIPLGAKRTRPVITSQAAPVAPSPVPCLCLGGWTHRVPPARTELREFR